MRARTFIAILTVGLGLAAAGPLCAADLMRAPQGSTRSSYQKSVRAGMLVIADDRPGIALRPYWRQPWHQRHYFPATGRKPRVGRDENLSARHAPLRRAASFERHWWVSSAIAPELSPRSPVTEAEPRLK
jgi:hypothetical protein